MKTMIIEEGGEHHKDGTLLLLTKPVERKKENRQPERDIHG